MVRAAAAARDAAARRTDPEVARILGGGGGRGGRGGRGGAAAGPTLASVTAMLGTALTVAESADRTPPASAYQIADQAGRDLAALLSQLNK